MSRLPERSRVAGLMREITRGGVVGSIYYPLEKAAMEEGPKRVSQILDVTLADGEGIDTYLSCIASVAEGGRIAPNYLQIFDIAFDHLKKQIEKGLVLDTSQIESLQRALDNAPPSQQNSSALIEARAYLKTYASEAAQKVQSPDDLSRIKYDAWEGAYGEAWRAQQAASAVTPTQGSAVTGRVSSATTVRGHAAATSPVRPKPLVGTSTPAHRAPAISKPTPANKAAASKQSGNEDARHKARYDAVMSADARGTLEQFFQNQLNKDSPGYKGYKNHMLSAMSEAAKSQNTKLFNKLAMIYLSHIGQPGARLEKKELDRILSPGEYQGDLRAIQNIIGGLERLAPAQSSQTVKQATPSLGPSATPKISVAQRARGLVSKWLGSRR